MQKADQLDNAHRNSRVRSIAMTFFGLACAYDLAPQECRLALGLPSALDLAQEFAEHVQAPQCEAWHNMVTACCLMRFNPPVGDQQVPLLEALLTHLPAMSVQFALFNSLDLLVALGRVYGLPDRDGLAAELQPYRRNLVNLARGSQKAIQQDAGALESWRGSVHSRTDDIIQLLETYAMLR